MAAILSPRLDEQQLRREYYGNLAVEALQRMIATGTLIAFAIFAALFVSDVRTSALVTGLVIIGLVHLAYVTRLQEGGDLVRRGLFLAAPGVDDGGPYRSAPAVAQRRSHLPPHVLFRDAALAAAFTAAAIAALR